MKMQAETKAVYEKYGTSPTGGCLQLLIQLPIIYALFRVINNIPAYVASVKMVFMNIVTPLMAENDFMGKISTFAEAHNMSMEKYDFSQSNYVIDLLYKFTDTEWGELITQFPDLTTVITENLERINNMNNFLGINLAEAPGFALTPALLIPILSGVTQWISTKLMTANQPINDSGEENTMASSMKMMNNFLPLMSAFFCITMPSGLGIYWVATSTFMILQQIILNMYFNRMDMEELIMKNLEKANKKRAKKGLPPQKVSNVAKQTVRNIENAEQIKEEQKKRIEETHNKIKESTEYYNKSAAKPGSLAAKANMVQQYNERTEKRKK